MKVLLVDDSNTMRRIARTQLAALGITDIVEAENGQDAIEKLKANMPIDLVTMDINMPVMDGMTALKEIRKDATFADVKIVMLTSESEKKTVLDALQAGANNYIVKPFTPDALKQKLGL